MWATTLIIQNENDISRSSNGILEIKIFIEHAKPLIKLRWDFIYKYLMWNNDLIIFLSSELISMDACRCSLVCFYQIFFKQWSIGGI